MTRTYSTTGIQPQKTVAVIGAGISGLTAAYKLAQMGFKIEVFEASDRMGGRIFTDHKSFANQGQFCERGGEWIDSTHHETIGLAHEFGLDIENVGAKRQGEDLFFFEGKYYKPSDFLEYEPGKDNSKGGFVALAKYIRADRDRAKTSKSYARELDATNVHDYLQKAKTEALMPDGTPTPDWVIDAIDMAYKGEFGVHTTRQSSLLLINQIGVGPRHPFEVYGPRQDESRRIKGGNSLLIEALVKKCKELGVTFHNKTKLTKIEYDGRRHGGEGVSLKFHRNEAVEGVKDFMNTFDHAICTVPFTKLRELKGLGLSELRRQGLLSREKFDAIHQLQYGNITKVMLGMKHLPIDKIPGSNGSFRTDDPFLQNTWITSIGQPGMEAILTILVAGDVVDDLKLQKIVDGCKNAFCRMVKMERQDIFNENKTMQAWGVDHLFKGSYSAFAPGQYGEMRLHAGTPEVKGRLGFAGEHTDPEDYGYMNGAIRSGIREAERIIAMEMGRGTAIRR